MSVLPPDILKSAEDLVAVDPTSEAITRTAVSRAYYSAYHDCRIWHDSLAYPGQCPPDARGTHNILCLNLQKPHGANPLDARLKSSRRGILLRKLHGDRVTADYVLDEAIDRADAYQAIADAKVIVGI